MLEEDGSLDDPVILRERVHALEVSLQDDLNAQRRAGGDFEDCYLYAAIHERLFSDDEEKQARAISFLVRLLEREKQEALFRAATRIAELAKSLRTWHAEEGMTRGQVLTLCEELDALARELPQLEGGAA